ncbi:MAG: hypothetical protein A3F09_04295 [Chlamydiae bacterium RIFCSPHIGHO2_12_FULL_49_11]|nr:MAG: hypothetical protein A3F09_04295 [Chlamydiae bacterium RIFCSPHIGHO2_12_FULL_49_11]
MRFYLDAHIRSMPRDYLSFEEKNLTGLSSALAVLSEKTDDFSRGTMVFFTEAEFQTLGERVKDSLPFIILAEAERITLTVCERVPFFSSSRSKKSVYRALVFEIAKYRWIRSVVKRVPLWSKKFPIDILNEYRMQTYLMNLLPHRVCTILSPLINCRIYGVYIEEYGGTSSDMRRMKNFQEILDYAEKFLEALEELHYRGVVHTDLKQLNVLIDDLGKIKFIDLEFATTEDIFAERTIGQSYPFFSHAFKEGKVLKETDIWAFLAQFGYDGETMDLSPEIFRDYFRRIRVRTLSEMHVRSILLDFFTAFLKNSIQNWWKEGYCFFSVSQVLHVVRSCRKYLCTKNPEDLPDPEMLPGAVEETADPLPIPDGCHILEVTQIETGIAN